MHRKLLYLKNLFNIKYSSIFRVNYTSVLLLLALLSSFFTYREIAESQLYAAQNPKFLITLIILDLILFFVLFTLVLRQALRIWHKGKKQSGRLQSKIIFMFCIVAGVPTIIVTVFSTIFFNFGIQSWFDQRVSTAINESVVVAESYFRVQLKLIESDAVIMAQDLNYLTQNKLYNNSEQISIYLTKQADDRNLVEAVIFQASSSKIIAQSRYNFTMSLNEISSDVMAAAKNNVVVIKGDDDNKVRSLIRLDFMPDCYLLVGRIIDNKVLDHMVNTKGAESEYKKLRGQISNLQIQFLIVFVVVSLLLLLTAIWLGLSLSSALIRPLNLLMSATEQITEGNYNITLVESNRNDEISLLTKAFNSMALELSNQREKLIEANYEIQAKHHFSEAVLFGVSAGVVALDLDYKISSINRAAINILSLHKEQELIGKSFSSLCPEITNLLPYAKDLIGYEVKKEITINRSERNSILIVRILIERFLGKTAGYIVTFDDVTTLVLAQRSAAWSDVARKIAHEIKNPLTPIHLAAERLKKKYLKEVEDVKNFEKYLDIITKHVKDIGMMVEEFVQFARMPAPEFAKNNLSQLVREAIFSRKCIEQNIQYVTNIDIEPAMVYCDYRQISQVLLNLFKNAEESIQQNTSITIGKIIVSLTREYDNLILSVVDNGLGFPLELFDRLTEPYITSKSTGTGLGLAIVKKILDDHKIEISFSNNQHKQGATIKLIFKESS